VAQVRKILIADPDLEAVRMLTRALRQRGYQVHYAPDGARALEVCVLRHPDLVLFDEGCKLLEARTFIQILRTNPRTEDIPVVLTTTSLDVDRLRGLRLAAHLKKPFNLDEVLSRIEHIFRRTEAAKDLKNDAQEIEGSLSQLGIPDLMQILGMNKRSGKLSLERGNERGEILVGDGRPVNARLGRVEGEKALFRLLMWTEGSFTFAPGTSAGKPRITRGMDDALMEGMRQADEVNRLLPSLPARNMRLVIAPDADLPQDQHPVTAQVVDLLRQPRSLGEVLDLAPATDREVLGVITTLMQKGVARLAEGEEEGSGPLLGAAGLRALRSRVLRGMVPLRVVTA
jgi:CheY-like chemotaxis protein